MKRKVVDYTQKSYLMRMLSLTKVGIIIGNILPTIAGIFLATRFYSLPFSFLNLVFVITSSAVIIACGCVLNNWLDEDIDQFMQRTKTRVLPLGLVKGSHAVLFGWILGIIAVLMLTFLTNQITTQVAIIALFFYLIPYTILTKRTNLLGVHIGGISGAIPPVIGYVSVSNWIDINAIILFFILFFWQVPHSYAIQIFRKEDYLNAKIKTVPSKKGLQFSKILMILHAVIYAILCYFLAFYNKSIAIAIGGISGLYWNYIIIIKHKEADLWAKKVFFVSIVTLCVMCISIIV